MALAPFLAFAATRLLSLDNWWPMTTLIAFTPAVAVLTLAPLLLALALRSLRVAVAALATALALAAVVVPRATGSGATVAPSQRFVVMTANLRLGAADPRSLLEIVRDHHVDVLSLQELTPEAARRLRVAGIADELPGQLLEPRSGAAGSGLMTRMALTAEPLREPGAAQPEAQVRLAGLGALRIKAAHPPPPITRANVRDWKARIDAMPAPYEGGTPRILAGDFNATLDHSQLRSLLHRGYSDAADATGDGLRSTFPGRGLRPGITIDHILVPRSIAVVSTTVVELPGSDHNAVIAVLGPASSS